MLRGTLFLLNYIEAINVPFFQNGFDLKAVNQKLKNVKSYLDWFAKEFARDWSEKETQLVHQLFDQSLKKNETLKNR